MPEDIRVALLRAAEEALDTWRPVPGDISSAPALAAAGNRCASVLSQFHAYVEGLKTHHTRNEVNDALNWAAEQAEQITNPDSVEYSSTIETRDTINLMVNLTAERLDGAHTAAEAIAEAYGGEDIQQWHGWFVNGWVNTEPCDECGADIPATAPDTVNYQHETSCSLHPGNVAGT
jgi:hypothetical protein